MSLVKKKICMIGDFAVGKTSLTQRFVKQMFSEQYLTTIGVKIDTKTVVLTDGQECKAVVWDVAGRDSLTPLQTNYLIGASAFMLVVDVTRRDSIESMKFLIDSTRQQLPDAPFIILLNKWDKGDQIIFNDKDQDFLNKNQWQFVCTSAKTGENVENAFFQLIELTMKSN